jgi:hypothetical protein
MRLRWRKPGACEVRPPAPQALVCHDSAAVHEQRGHVAEVSAVPREPEQRRVRARALVDDGGVLLVPEVEEADGAVGRDGGEDPGLAPGDVVHGLVVRDELRFDDAAFDVPDGAGGVDGRGPDAVGLDLVPVEGGERRAELGGGCLAVVEDGAELGRGGGGGGEVVERGVPEAERVGGGGEERRGHGAGVELELGGRVGVVEGERGERAEGGGGADGVEGEEGDAVVEVLEEAAGREHGSGRGEGQRVDRVRELAGEGVRVRRVGRRRCGRGRRLRMVHERWEVGFGGDPAGTETWETIKIIQYTLCLV